MKNSLKTEKKGKESKALAFLYLTAQESNVGDWNQGYGKKGVGGLNVWKVHNQTLSVLGKQSVLINRNSCLLSREPLSN